MKATITIEYDFDGDDPGKEKTIEAFFQAVDSNYIPSEKVDGTDKWALEIKSFVVDLNSSEKQTVYVLHNNGYNATAHSTREKAEDALDRWNEADKYYADIEMLVIDKYINEKEENEKEN